MCTTVHRSCTTSHNGRLGSRWSRSWSVRNVNRFFPKTWSHFFWGGLQEAFWYYYCPTPWCRKFWWHGSLRCCSAGVGCGPLTSGEPGRNKGSHSHTEAHAGIIILGARQKRQQRVCFICLFFVFRIPAAGDLVVLSLLRAISGKKTKPSVREH